MGECIEIIKIKITWESQIFTSSLSFLQKHSNNIKIQENKNNLFYLKKDKKVINTFYSILCLSSSY